MKKFVILSMLFTLYTFSLKAQIKVGIKGGFNLSNFYANQITDKNFKDGGHFGLFLETSRNSFLGFRPELLYSMKGAEYHYGAYTSQANLGYLDMPFLLELNVVKIFNLQFGPQVSYLLHVNYSYIYQENNHTVIRRVIKDAINYSPGDAGIAMGISFHISRFDLGFRYNRGFIAIDKKGHQVVINKKEGIKVKSPGPKNSWYQLFLGFDL